MSAKNKPGICVDEIMNCGEMSVKPSEVIGLDESSAIQLIEQRGFCARIIRKDNMWFVVTAEASPSRVNLEIENNKVVNAAIG